MIHRLLESSDPAIRALAGDGTADPLDSTLVRTLLDFPDQHPYAKWYGAHWRLVSLADLGVPAGTPELARGVEQELAWLTSDVHRRRIRPLAGLMRVCASQEGNAVYACSALGFADDPRVRSLVDSLLEWQWPDGGWNCDRRASGRRSSFHETVTPAIGLAKYSEATGDPAARAAAERAAQLVLEHRLFRAHGTGKEIHPSWTKPHYPPYWHYDVLQGLRLVQAAGLTGDERACDALDLLERARRRDGRFSGPAWWSARQPDAVDWGSGASNEMLNVRIETVLATAGRT